MTASFHGSLSLGVDAEEDAEVVVHDGNPGHPPIAAIHFRDCTIMSSYDAGPGDLAHVLRALADRVDAEHAAWLAQQQQGEGTDA
jgi:hypothetical protein